MNRNTSFFWLTDTTSPSSSSSSSSSRSDAAGELDEGQPADHHQKYHHHHNEDEDAPGWMIDDDDADDDEGVRGGGGEAFDEPSATSFQRYFGTSSNGSNLLYNNQQRQQQRQQQQQDRPQPPPPPSPIPAAAVRDDEEAQPLVVVAHRNDYGSGHQDDDKGLNADGDRRRPAAALFALSEHSPVHRTPPVSSHHRRKFMLNSNKNHHHHRDEMGGLRFQVVIWHVGEVDVIRGQVPMRLRITMFWNDRPPTSNTNSTISTRETAGDGATMSSTALESEWIMKGRQRACRCHVGSDEILETLDVPPVSILNAVSFDTLDAEISMLDAGARLMRWTCMYRVDLFQADHMTVEQFPHDRHELKIKIGILAHRGTGGRWDRKVHSLGLATERDSRGSTGIPHGLVVEHVAIPDFDYDASELSFSFLPLEYGAAGRKSGFGGSKTNATPASSATDSRDHYLQVQLPVYRVSGHYDRSIMPILALLNIVAVTCIPRNFSSATASTETLLSIAFVQVGIRLTIDSRLPSVGYPVKMQKVLNHAFWMICGLTLESNVIFFLVVKRGWQISTTDRIDCFAAVVALLYTAYIIAMYYSFERRTVPIKSK